MNAAKTANSEPIPGYRLIAALGSGGFGEVWTCEAPGGLLKAVKFVRGESDDIYPGSVALTGDCAPCSTSRICDIPSY